MKPIFGAIVLVAAGVNASESQTFQDKYKNMSGLIESGEFYLTCGSNNFHIKKRYFQDKELQVSRDRLEWKSVDGVIWGNNSFQYDDYSISWTKSYLEEKTTSAALAMAMDSIDVELPRYINVSEDYHSQLAKLPNFKDLFHYRGNYFYHRDINNSGLERYQFIMGVYKYLNSTPLLESSDLVATDHGGSALQVSVNFLDGSLTMKNIDPIVINYKVDTYSIAERLRKKVGSYTRWAKELPEEIESYVTLKHNVESELNTKKQMIKSALRNIEYQATLMPLYTLRSASTDLEKERKRMAEEELADLKERYAKSKKDYEYTLDKYTLFKKELTSSLALAKEIQQDALLYDANVSRWLDELSLLSLTFAIELPEESVTQNVWCMERR